MTSKSAPAGRQLPDGERTVIAVSLRPGDVLTSTGETVESCRRNPYNTRTVDLVLVKGTRRRSCNWNAGTLVTIMDPLL